MSAAAAPPPVRGSSAPSGQRLASTIRLPWFVGLGALLTLAVVYGGLAGRDTTEAGVSHAVLNAQEATAVGSAQQVRRSLNEGIDDLVQAARVLDEDRAAGTVRADRAVTVLRATLEAHNRYASLALVDADTGRTVLGVPGEQPPAPLGRLADSDPQMRVLEDGRIVQSAPVGDGGGLLVAAVYDPAFLLPQLVPRPNGVYVVDEQARALAALGAVGLGDPLGSSSLRRAAELGRDVTGASASALGAESSTVVAYAPVEGFGPAGDAGLALVVVRDVPTAGPVASYRLSGTFAALLLAGVVVLLFRWLHTGVIRPVLDVQREAERIAYGDLSRPVRADRDDEVGRLARSLERLRLALIRADVQDLDIERTER